MKSFAANLSLLLAVLPYIGALATATPALAQVPPITPAPDGTGTAVTPQGNTFNIQGGSLSRDGANLFHSFQKFGLSEGQTANFLTNPDIRNILGRVVGGDASYINGLIQVSGGNSNLFLMNPAGILFGPNASLNVPASFTATTATGIGFGSGWFNAVGSNDYNVLVGTPSEFNFAVSQPGAIVNEGNLTLTSGNSLTLLGGTVINTGTLTSPGGYITIAAVPGDSAVRISQEGHLLSLDIEPAALTGAEGTPVLQPLSLPQLLTGRPDFGHASALSVSEKGEVSLTGSGVRIPASGGIAAGNIDTSSEVGDGGAITLNATSDIITGSLRTAAGGTGTGGNIEIVSSAGGINTSAGAVDSSSVDGNGGNVTLTAERDIVTGEIKSGSVGEIIYLGTDEYGNQQFSSKGGTGTGGNIALESRSGAVDTSAGSLSSYSLERDGGSVTLSAAGNIKIGNIISSSGYLDMDTYYHSYFGPGTGSGGNISITSRDGGIDTSNSKFTTLYSYSYQGNGGSVTLHAFGDIKTGSIYSYSPGYYDADTGTTSGTGSGGNIILNSSAGGIDTASGGLLSYSTEGNGGSVTLTASGDIKTGAIQSLSYGTGNGGNITLNSSAGNIYIDSWSLDSFSHQGNGGSVTLHAFGDIKTGSIQSYSSFGTGSGGNITINSSAGGIDTLSGQLDSFSGQGNGGSLTLKASGTISTGYINSSGLLRGGDITITSQLSDIIYRGFIDTSSQNGTRGNITENPYAGSISTGNLNGLRNITIAAGGDDEPIAASPAASATSDAGKINTVAGNVTLSAHNDITVSQPIKTSSITSLELIAGRSININADIDTSASNGNIALRANSNSADPKYRESGAGSVTMAPGTALNAGSGNIVIELGRLAEVGNITLSNINTAGALTVNAATGNILRSSADSLITAGRAFFQTATSGAGGIGFPAEPLRISVSNLEATAGSSGAFFESPELGVTVGGATELPIGIVTSGDVDLRAAADIEITEQVSTASILSRNAGNITFNSSSGAINASTTLKSNALQGNGGSVALTASGDIKTGEISSYSWGDGNGGNIALTSSAGGIDTANNLLSSSSAERNGGSVTLTASEDIKTGDIESYSRSNHSGGDITLKSSAGGIDTTGGRLSSGSWAGNGGSVTLTASGDIKTGDIESASSVTGSGGNIALNSSAGGIDTAIGRLSSYSDQGNAGSVTLSASGDIKTGQIASMAGFNPNVMCSPDNCDVGFTPIPGSTGTGGDITIESSRGIIDTSAYALNTMSYGGRAGNVTIKAAGHIETADIRSEGLLQGGNITINSASSNSINVGGNLDTYSDSGTAGTVTLTSPGSITTREITSYGQTKSGDISVTSNSTVTTNSIKTQSGTGPSGNITINGNNIATGNLDSLGRDRAGNIQVTASGNVTTLNIESRAQSGDSGNIGVEAGGDITTGNQTTTATNGNSGDITDTAGGDMTVGNQTTTSTNGNSGNITNTAGNNITAGNQTTTATNGNSGNITDTAGGNITARNQTTTATNGNSGNITNTAGNNITAGNQTTSATGGTAGDITNTAVGSITAGNITSTGTQGSGNITLTSATGEINTGAVHTDTGEVNINAGVNPLPVPVPVPDSTQTVPVPDSTQTVPVLSNPLIHSVSSDSSTNPNISTSKTALPDGNAAKISDSSAQQILASLNALNSSPLAVNSTQIIAQLEQSRGQEFADYFGQKLSPEVTAESIRDALATIASQTGNRSAIIYITALPDELELVVFPPEGHPVRKTVPAASREELLKLVAEFRDKLTNPVNRKSTNYLPLAAQLYQRLIAPIEPELQAAKIDTLLFSMDAGLRSLPVAALHDGKQFLIEKYSLALIPSVSLMDTRYQPLQGKQVLAMGASEFPDQKPLFAVPVELSEITQKLWQGKALLNQDFTRDNLIEQRSNYPYPMIHLATHGEFNPGDISNSYIALWNEKLRLDELRNLRLNNPPVELLVLSACRTAVGDEKAELGFAGFAVAAGVKTAVASLWYVSDTGTLGLMAEFYQHLANAKIKAEALRQAQLAMIRGEVRIEKGELRQTGILGSVALPAELLKEGSHNLSHPYYWSGFTMIGSPW
jgi:filamentous hemagglutinin family protein